MKKKYISKTSTSNGNKLILNNTNDIIYDEKGFVNSNIVDKFIYSYDFPNRLEQSIISNNVFKNDNIKFSKHSIIGQVRKLGINDIKLVYWINLDNQQSSLFSIYHLKIGIILKLLALIFFLFLLYMFFYSTGYKFPIISSGYSLIILLGIISLWSLVYTYEQSPKIDGYILNNLGRIEQYKTRYETAQK